MQKIPKQPRLLHEPRKPRKNKIITKNTHYYKEDDLTIYE